MKGLGLSQHRFNLVNHSGAVNVFNRFLCLPFLTLCGSIVFAQNDAPAPDSEAVDSTEYAAMASTGAMVESSGRVARSIIDQAYRSAGLHGNFTAQWMYINQGGRRVTFWGARIIRLEPDSPLRSLGVRSGDVITRLDGIPIWRGMYKESGGPWQVVELDNHFGQTEVRYIARGTHQVRVGQINIDTTEDDSSPLPP